MCASSPGQFLNQRPGSNEFLRSSQSARYDLLKIRRVLFEGARPKCPHSRRLVSSIICNFFISRDYKQSQNDKSGEWIENESAIRPRGSNFIKFYFIFYRHTTHTVLFLFECKFSQEMCYSLVGRGGLMDTKTDVFFDRARIREMNIIQKSFAVSSKSRFFHSCLFIIMFTITIIIILFSSFYYQYYSLFIRYYPLYYIMIIIIIITFIFFFSIILSSLPCLN